MLGSRQPSAVAIALLLAALAAAGCGLGPGEDLGEVELTVTREYGSQVLVGPQADGVSEADTVMRVLERNAEIDTRYGGGFVEAIDGLQADEGGGGPFDWFFYVNGVESTVGAGDYPLHGGEAVWWDYRDWSAAMRVPALVGSWPRPLSGGYDGEGRPVAVECSGGGAEACGIARERLEAAGVALASRSPDGAIRVLVGPWARLREDPAAAQIEDGPEASGVFATFTQGREPRLTGLDAEGEEAQAFGPGAGLVAATRRYEEPPVWVVTGTGAEGVAAAARLLDAADLRDRYAVATEGGRETPLPVR